MVELKKKSWWNFTTSAKLAIKFGGDEGIKLVELYEAKFQVKLLEMEYLQLPIICEPSELLMKANKKINSNIKKRINELRSTIANLNISSKYLTTQCCLIYKL